MKSIDSTSFIHLGPDGNPVYLILAFSTSEEPHRNLLPYIKVFDNSIIAAHMRYCKL